jgi:hypothetical protein
LLLASRQVGRSEDNMAEQTEVLAQAPKPFGPITTSAQAYEAQRQLIPEVAQAEADVKKAEAEVETFRLGERAKAAEDYATKVRGETARTQKMLNESPFPQFEPTKENAQSLGELFSLTATFGLLLGNMGKTSSLGAMNAMTGMLGGWRQGRMDLFNKEKAEFDKNLGVMKAKHEEYKKDLEQYLKLAATDRDAANAKADEMAAKLGSQSVPGTYARLRDRKGLLDQLAAQAKVLEKMEERKRQAEERRKDREEAERRHREDLALRERDLKARERMHQETLKAQAAKAQASVGDLPAYINRFTGSTPSKQNAEAIMTSANAVGDAYALQKVVAEHPEWVGRTGQVKNFFNRTLESINAGKPLPDDQGQPELIFAKRYAEYLTNYERALAGGARGFTVYFQRRFNQLLEQNQFNAAGFKNLMDEQIRTVTSRATEKSPTINRQKLTALAYDMKARAGDDDATSAMSALIGGDAAQPAAAAPAAKKPEQPKRIEIEPGVFVTERP